MSRQESEGKTATRLTAADWSRAALGAIAQRGVSNVSVERLARELGATKGSFYWHFKDRSALIVTALELWELEHTDRVIKALSPIADPRDRFRRLIEISFREETGALIDANLLASADDPTVADALERVARKRLAFVDRIFAELDAPGGSDRALLAYSAYVGLAHLRRTAPAVLPSGPRIDAYVDHAVGWLLGQ